MRFRDFAVKTCTWLGSSAAFLSAVCLIVLWLAFGPANDYSDTWQLVINTATTVITF